MTNFDRIKKMLNGSTTMPVGTAGESQVHYHDGVACNHDHSNDHGHDIGPEHHVHDENCNHEHEEHVHDENCNHDHDKK